MVASAKPHPHGGAVLTGSQVYGTPAPESDVDLVVLCDGDTQVLLATLLSGEKPENPGSGPRGGISLRAGRLNLILTDDPEQVERWREGTLDLKARAPVTRAEAVEHLRLVVGDGDQAEHMQARVPKHGEVWKGVDGRKFVMASWHLGLCYTAWTYVCATPHADGDYSYLCQSTGCRCQS